MDRDMEIPRLTARLRALRRFGLDLCLGHIVSAGNREPSYIGRLGLTDATGRRLLLDWRSPAAEPFSERPTPTRWAWPAAAGIAGPAVGSANYWDEVFTPDGLAGHAALDDQSAFIASLGSSRSAGCETCSAPIQADQDALIRAGSRGALVVDGGPGTGKTVVALHRSAYLLYSDPRLSHRRGGVLFVGSAPALPATSPTSCPASARRACQTCTLRDLVPRGSRSSDRDRPDVARLKSSADL